MSAALPGRVLAVRGTHAVIGAGRMRRRCGRGCRRGRWWWGAGHAMELYQGGGAAGGGFEHGSGWRGCRGRMGLGIRGWRRRVR